MMTTRPPIQSHSSSGSSPTGTSTIRSARLPLAFVVLSLLALAVIPPVLWWRTQEIRDEISTVADPARGHIDEIQFQLAREVSAARGYLLTRDPEFVAQIEDAHAATERAYADLRPLARQLGPRVDEHLNELRAEEQRWHSLTTQLIEGQITPEDYIGRMPVQQALYEDALRAASRLGGIIGEAAEERRARMRQITSFSTVLMVLLALAALLSTYFVSRLGSQLQAHSRQLARRAEEERGLRELAHSLTATVDLEEVLQRIADGALYTGRAVGAHVERVFFGAEELEVAAASGSGSPPVGTRIPYPGSLAEDVIERRAPEVIRNLAGQNRPIARFLAESCSNCSALILPLISEEEALGALVLLRQAEGRGWTADEIERTQTLASLAAVALRRVLLLHVVQQHAAELEESERRFRLMVEGVRDYAIFMLTPEGRIASWNTGAERIMGYSAEEVLGEHFSTFYMPEDRARRWPQEELARAERLGRFEDQGWRVRKDGSRFWADTVLTAIRGERDELVGFAKVTRDLTERKRAEEIRDQALVDARDAREQADAANQAKSQFLATMSHEIRTPINAIMGYTDLLDAEIAGPLTAGQRDQIGRIQASSRHLLTLINDILDLSKVEAGEMRIQAVPLRLRDTALAAISLIEPQAAAKEIALQEEVACRENATYLGDEDRVRQILVNLLSNAVKFTDAGGTITVRCRVLDRPVPDARVQGPGHWAAIDVEDTGVGVPAGQLGPIFEPFVQVDSGHTRQHGGTGLGLAISRRLARLMGGDLTARSVPGQGSTFTLWLPTVPKEVGTPLDPLPLPRVAREVHGLDEIGRILAQNAEDLTRTLGERLRTDPEVPSAHGRSAPELHDHVATFLVDIGRSLVTLHEDGSEPGLLRDSSEVQRLISDLHGRQRHRLGWSAEELNREFRILDEEAEQLIRRELEQPEAADLERGLAVLRHLLQRAEQISRDGLLDGSAESPSC